MEPRSIFSPVLALVLLTFLVWVRMYTVRVPAVLKSGFTAQQLDDAGRMEEVLKVAAKPSDNLVNLLEVPVLFYVATLVIFVAGLVDARFVQLAWVYVALRAIHSLVACTIDRTMFRFGAYFTSSLVLFAIWIRIAVQLNG